MASSRKEKDLVEKHAIARSAASAGYARRPQYAIACPKLNLRQFYFSSNALPQGLCTTFAARYKQQILTFSLCRRIFGYYQRLNVSISPGQKNINHFTLELSDINVGAGFGSDTEWLCIVFNLVIAPPAFKAASQRWLIAHSPEHPSLLSLRNCFVMVTPMKRVTLLFSARYDREV
jgi:hypothetical protein